MTSQAILKQWLPIHAAVHEASMMVAPVGGKLPLRTREAVGPSHEPYHVNLFNTKLLY